MALTSWWLKIEVPFFDMFFWHPVLLGSFWYRAIPTMDSMDYDYIENVWPRQVARCLERFVAGRAVKSNLWS